MISKPRSAGTPVLAMRRRRRSESRSDRLAAAGPRPAMLAIGCKRDGRSLGEGSGMSLEGGFSALGTSAGDAWETDDASIGHVFPCAYRLLACDTSVVSHPG